MNNYNETDFQKELIGLSQEDFDKKICTRFPKFFAQRGLPKTESCMYWGFEIGPGWRPILWELCEKLDRILNEDSYIEFTQIKEKYGSGRFYYCTYHIDDYTYEIIHELISTAEDKCDRICAETGKYYEDKIIMGSWIYDVCPEVFRERNKDYPDVIAEMERRITINREWKNLIREVNWINNTDVKEKIIKLIVDSGIIPK